MPARKRTMKDIAKELGVSQTTVSFTLNGKADQFGISAATQQRIWDHVESIGYVPDVDAAAMAGQGRQLRRVGILIANGLTSNHKAIFFDLLHQLPALGMTPVIYSVVPETFAQGVRFLMGKNTQDVIFIGRQPVQWFYQTPRVHAMLQDKKLYFVDVAFPDALPADPLPGRIVRIGIDRAQAYRQAIESLVGQGHRHILLTEHASPYLPSLRQAFASLSLEVFDSDTEEADGTGRQKHRDLYIHGLSLTGRVLELVRLHRSTALFTGDDELALGLMAGLLAKEVKVPQQLSIIGFDGIPAGAYGRVALSTIQVPVQEMSQKVKSLLSSSKFKPGDHLLASRVLWRQSTSSPMLQP